MSKNFKLKWRAGRTGAELACGSKDMKSVSGQSGRSMVEMLGVLAIIGVLSIGGIAGYRMAMDRHHANEWLNGYNQFKVELEAYEHQHDVGKDYTFSSGDYILQNDWCNDYGECSRQMTIPSLHSKGSCKMIFEAVNPIEDFGINIPHFHFSGSSSASECYDCETTQCQLDCCERINEDHFKSSVFIGI